MAAYIVTPGTWSTAPTSKTNGLGWFPGFWSVLPKEQIRMAEADPTDTSHIIFRYAYGIGPYADEPNDSAFYEFHHALDGKTIVVDVWLGDDGNVTARQRQ
jgi:hypothetical protein